MLDNYFPLLVYALLAIAIPASMIVMSFVFATRPKRRTRARRSRSSRASRRASPEMQRFTVSFYLTAMLFIVFDIEIVFLYPVAVVLEQVGWFAVAEFGFFIGDPRARIRLRLEEGGAGMAADRRARR